MRKKKKKKILSIGNTVGGVITQKNIGAAHSEGGVRGKGRGDLCVFNFIAYLLSLGPSPSSSPLPAIYLTKYHNEDTTKTPFPSTFHFSFLIFFQAGRTLAWFSLLVLRCGSGCQIKAQAAARVGRSGTSEEGAGTYPPAA